MNYHENEFIALVDAIERDGGQLLPDAHKPQTLRYQRSPKDPDKYIDVRGIGCGSVAQFVIPYDPGEQVDLPDMSSLSNTIKKTNEGHRRVEIVNARPKVKSEEVAVDNLRAQRSRGAGLVTVCAVDDNVGAWPRYRDAMSGGDDD